MTHEEILNKSIEIAIERGWEFDNLDKWNWSTIRKTDTTMNNWYYFLIAYNGNEKFIDAERIIYDQNFAKALFEGMKVPRSRETTDDEHELDVWGKVLGLYSGGGYEGYGDRCTFHGETWQYHLQQMVIADDPIKYLGDHL